MPYSRVDGVRQSPLRSLYVAASGLSVQRARIDTIANNIANAETTRTPEGGPYRRQRVVAREAPGTPMLRGTVGTPELDVARVRAPKVGEGDPFMDEFFYQRLQGAEVAGIEEDPSEGQLVYDPGHPDADEAGYVRMPNVHITDEIVDMMGARRLFEANASVFQAIKSMLRQASQL